MFNVIFNLFASLHCVLSKYFSTIVHYAGVSRICKKKKEKKNKLDSSRLQFIAKPAEFVAVIYTVAKRITFLGSAMFVAD